MALVKDSFGDKEKHFIKYLDNNLMDWYRYENIKNRWIVEETEKWENSFKQPRIIVWIRLTTFCRNKTFNSITLDWSTYYHEIFD